MTSNLRADLVEFVVSNYLFGDSSRLPADEESLILTGVVDSTGILELIEFLEDRFGVTVGDTEAVPDNLGSIASLVRFVSAKQAGGTIPGGTVLGGTAAGERVPR